jgi:hypothetical protein
MLEHDKNNSTCRSCNERLKYIVELERQLNFSRCSETQQFARCGSMPLARMPYGASSARLFVN